LVAYGRKTLRKTCHSVVAFCRPSFKGARLAAKGGKLLMYTLLGALRREFAMRDPVSLLMSAGLGAGAMYFFDPNVGRRRRAILRDQAVHAVRDCRHAADLVRRDASNRLYGAYAEVRGGLRRDEPTDDVLEARVRAKIGRSCSHAAAIEVDASEGRVLLSGPVLAEEVQQVINAARSVRGVESVDNALEVHDEPGNVSALQGGSWRTGEHMEMLQGNWSPAARGGAGLAGLAVASCCFMRRDPLAILAGAVGLALSVKALTNVDSRGGSARQTLRFDQPYRLNREGSDDLEMSGRPSTLGGSESPAAGEMSAQPNRTVVHDL
jgi:hypothetical protein